MILRFHFFLGAITCVTSACGDDAGSSSPTDATDDSSLTSADTSGADASATHGTGGELGPTAQVRIVNLVEGMTFDVWGADADFSPVMVAQDLAFETVSDYFDAPLNEFTMDPQIVLLPAGEVPEDVATWQVDNSSGPDRAFVIVSELDAADEHATLIVSLDAFTSQLQYEQLDETELMLGDTSQANLHISYKLFELGGSVVPAFAVVGEPCLFSGSTGVAQPWSVAPGTFDVGIYDIQTVSECTTQLASISITASAGEQVLVAMYHVADDARLLTAPIPQ